MMLQQTQIATALPYFDKWTERWPNWKSLSEASEDEVLSAWTGLGYYQRARRLLELAKVVVAEHDGVLPNEPKELAKLPGLGPYASEAVSAIAFNRPSFPVDGNVRRVLSRYYGNQQISPSKDQDAAFRENLLPAFRKTRRRRELAQALMELGALVCRPRQPLCDTCPIKKSCSCADPIKAMTFPFKKSKSKPRKKWILFIWYLGPQTTLLRKRPSSGRFPSQWEPVCIEAQDRESAMKLVCEILQPKDVNRIEWSSPFRRDFTTFHVHWEAGILHSDEEPSLDAYENIKKDLLSDMNLVPVIGKHWEEHLSSKD